MTKLPTNKTERREPATYEIRLQGHLDARWADQLNIAGLAHESDGTTVMRLAVADQAALHGLLQRIRDLGLPLISVTRIDPAPQAGTDDQTSPSPDPTQTQETK
jgi:hypothetical protein